eukprot:TRINITY_DN13470_c0_g1_i1.p1 TRINITY_DN13470_c0_g1~~TRINITY_DN13470_c0_g1_i1.p1  ORF type:complete len:279 (-),score=70.52 TRINITY_DN13470_c0_g1_i1:33-869(-)
MEMQSNNELDTQAQLLEEIKTNNRLLREVLQRVERIERFLGHSVGSQEENPRPTSNIGLLLNSDTFVDLTDDTEELRPSKRQKQDENESSTPPKTSRNGKIRDHLDSIDIEVEIRPESESSKEEISQDTPDFKRIKCIIDRRFPADLSRVKSTLQTETGIAEVCQMLFLHTSTGNTIALESTDQLVNGSRILLIERNRTANMKIFVKFPEGKTIPLMADPQDKIKDIKQIIREQEGTPEKLQRMFFGGRLLEDEDTVQQCRITEGVTLLIHPKLTTIA